MFQMNCSKCGGLVKSPLLAEIQVVECPQCEEIVRVQNVIVTTKKFSTGLRTSLKSLLISARDKFRLNRSHIVDAQTGYEIDKRLAKILRRDDFRLDLSFDLYVQVNFASHKRLARLLNISSIGAGIEFADGGKLPEDNSEINLHLPLNEGPETLSLLGRVVWSKIPAEDTISPVITMGVQFRAVDEEVLACLWNFIVNAETSGLTPAEE